MKLAFFSPLPPDPTGIADYAVDLLAELHRLAQVVVFGDLFDDVSGRQAKFDLARLPAGIKVHAAADFPGILGGGFDMCIYQVGNNLRYHGQIFYFLLRYPGIVVLHDLNLHGLLLHWAGRQTSPVSAFSREMAYAHGRQGRQYAVDLFASTELDRVQDFPAFARIVDHSLGVIVHSDYAQKIVAQKRPHLPVMHINQPIPEQKSQKSPIAAKARVEYASDTVLVGSLGYAAPNKQIHRVLEGLARLHNRLPQLRYVIVGEVVDGYELKALVNQLGLGEIVRFTGFVDRTLFDAYMEAIDIGVNLRFPTNGETSASLLRLMGAGKATLINEVDAFGELPDDACWKISIDHEVEAQIEQAILELATNRTLRSQMGDRARLVIQAQNNPQIIAQQTIGFIQDIHRRLAGTSLECAST